MNCPSEDEEQLEQQQTIALREQKEFQFP